MNKYKVEFIQTEKFCVDVLAEDEQEATDKATKQFNLGNYEDLCELSIEVGTVYDVTNTDDPFNP